MHCYGKYSDIGIIDGAGGKSSGQESRKGIVIALRNSQLFLKNKARRHVRQKDA